MTPATRRAEIAELARRVAPEQPFGGFGDAVASRAEAALLIQEIEGPDPGAGLVIEEPNVGIG
ncbi:MAG: hypothetical protein GY698_24815 [Actinomycetia bacterium]|nr:hypothetical protein [Actinomycetes bacterium]